MILDFVLVIESGFPEEGHVRVHREVVRAYDVSHARARFRPSRQLRCGVWEDEQRLIDIEPYDPLRPAHAGIPHRDRSVP